MLQLRPRPHLAYQSMNCHPPAEVPSGGCVSMLRCNVATASSFLLWMHSLVTSSSACTSSAVRCLTEAQGSKLNTWMDGQ